MLSYYATVEVNKDLSFRALEPFSLRLSKERIAVNASRKEVGFIFKKKL